MPDDKPRNMLSTNTGITLPGRVKGTPRFPSGNRMGSVFLNCVRFSGVTEIFTTMGSDLEIVTQPIIFFAVLSQAWRLLNKS
jgi:hypothetical protein